MPPSRKRLAVVGQAGGEGVALHPLARLLHQVGEGRQRHELAGGEEVAERRQAVVADVEMPSACWQIVDVRLPRRLRLQRDGLHAPASAAR